ncbi:fructose-2,6-bisphosphatase [Pseudomonas sp. Choline-3u-10]|jgi:broad specificity phosphatase PhoE|uniref:fructose 2,6-bisphosphatase n=1 Tax=Pseudomonadaceae TaxID=135621 RepID=UPI000535B8B8|nr:MULTISPECIES: fructose 2,6-bisphosphatase [Pseudomonadaceae]MAL37312.1 fructose-2,6-bisphosphatase [Pseudomonas sp.]MBU0949242.1 fructose-2,6-bisphosphatase [Gammaproteobacteria bacterium]BAP77733.1 fructose-2,6-bisphosphatase [Pseudomonas sp. MT-1]KJJ64443.1 fructose-2,6-bisphosphatase [Pseudomonas sp. 10B238]MBK3794061.1 fructose-2,6-bisphosphatase [Stutzerimonas stutzeri]|tara:strand:+ start:128 stop:715 length:588 start_codon:yes stop_codon:yes gene_type:complete
MQIILVRHGRPDHSADPWSTPAGMKDWVERYNAASVVAGERPESLLRLADAAGTVVCSSLMRCVESREHLNCRCLHQPDPLFAEAHLPYPNWAYPLMPSRVWRITFRTAWFLGFARHTEPVSESKRRASAAADKLIELAETHGSVLLMGHKIMNALIATQLRRRGWHGPPLPLLSGYWHPSRYRKSASSCETESR